MIPVTDHFASVELVLKGRTDTAIVTRSFIKQYLSEYPQHYDTLLISERIDQILRKVSFFDFSVHEILHHLMLLWSFHSGEFCKIPTDPRSFMPLLMIPRLVNN